MNGPWTLAEYQTLCEAILHTGYTVQSVDEFLSKPARRVVVLRHDVDRIPRNAVKMARLEHALGLRSTYYVRQVRGVYSTELLGTLHELGHEVGYHYEVLAKTRGDIAKASVLFKSELARFRGVVPVKTAAMHGSPLAPWNNLDIWQHLDTCELDLSEPYLAIDYDKVAYYTDTGRSWDATVTNLRDRVNSAGSHFARVHTTDELRALVAAGSIEQLCIQTHPERWSSSRAGLLRSAAMDYAANTAKRVLRGFRQRARRRPTRNLTPTR